MPYPVPLFQSTGRPAAAAAASGGGGGSSEQDAAAFSYPSWAYPRNYIAPSRNRQVRIWRGGQEAAARGCTGSAEAAHRYRRSLCPLPLSPLQAAARAAERAQHHGERPSPVQASLGFQCLCFSEAQPAVQCRVCVCVWHLDARACSAVLPLHTSCPHAPCRPAAAGEAAAREHGQR